MVRPKSQVQSNEQRVEIENDLPNKLRHLVERCDNALALDNRRFIERYVKMEMHILLQFRFMNGPEFVASFQRDGDYTFESSSQIGKGMAVIGTRVDFDDGLSFGWRHTARVRCDAGGKEQAVLVDCVKAMEFPERVVPIPSFVWFERIESFNNVLPKELYFSTNVGRHVFRGVVDNWELSPTRDHTGGPRKLVGQMVESAPEIVQSIPNDDRNFQGDIANTNQVVAALSCVEIILEPNTIWFGIPERLKGQMQILDVLFGPFDF